MTEKKLSKEIKITDENIEGFGKVFNYIIVKNLVSKKTRRKFLAELKISTKKGSKI